MEAIVFWGGVAALAIFIWLLQQLAKQFKQAARYRKLRQVLDRAKAFESELDVRAKQLTSERLQWEMDRQQQLIEIGQIARESDWLSLVG